MANYKLMIAYDGTRYRGWQRLKDTDDTIQGKIETVLSRMTSENIQVVAAGRTDGGAHAREQVANFHTKFKTTSDDIFKYLAAYLPKDIVVFSVTDADARFHAKFNRASSKFIYQIRTSLTPNPFDNKYRLHVPQKLDFGLMEQACARFMGTHDFTSFTSRKGNKSNERTITRLELVRDGNDLDIIFEGDDFLPNMVRIITGTLVEVGLGRLSVKDIDAIFAKQLRASAGYTVSPHGLFLEEITFK